MLTDRTLPEEKRNALRLLAALADALFFRPLKAVWWLFTNVRFAVALLAALSVVSLAGVMLPQMPVNIRGDSVAERAWVEFQEGKFGALTGIMDGVGLFDIFHAPWFAALMGITVASTGAYVLSRFPGIWANISRPRKRVPDRYLQIAPHRVELTEALDVQTFEGALRRARYRVERSEEGEATYIFADRFAWGQLGTLLTHAAIIVFIVAAVVSRASSYEAPLFLGEGSTLPVFPLRDPNQMQVQLVDAHAAFTPEGRPLDYRSEIAIFDGSEEVKRCTSTVNSPCSYRGYRFHQVGYFGFGAAVQVRDLTSGDVIYREVLALSDTMPSPHVRITDAQTGSTLFNEPVVLTDNLSTDKFTYFGAIVGLSNGRRVALGLQRPSSSGDSQLVVIEAGLPGDAARLLLDEGATAESAGLKVEYLRTNTIPAAVVPDLPLPTGGLTPALVEMTNAVYGTSNVSEGTNLAVPGTGGPPAITISGVGPQPLTLEHGQSAIVAGREYTFLGQRSFAGISVKRDRSDYLVWAGVTLILIGLMLTFWVPRRRLWAKIAPGCTYIAGQAAARANYARELRQLTRSAGGKLPEEPEHE